MPNCHKMTIVKNLCEERPMPKREKGPVLCTRVLVMCNVEGRLHKAPKEAPSLLALAFPDKCNAQFNSQSSQAHICEEGPMPKCKKGSVPNSCVGDVH